MSPSSLLPRTERARNVTAVLGPTNTGKTHLAIDRMLLRRTGLIGLPLRLLAREVYGRVVARMGPEVTALITGEEKIIPPGARYYVATVEAMPLDLHCEFVAIDEVQLAADLERGRVFTDRILRVRGTYETLLLGASTARQLLERLIPGLNVVTRARMSVLTYNGEKKITRLPPRSAVVAFSANEVYAIAELIRRQRGGAAIVMGALSPRTRNAQVELFQSGDVDFLVATDAIGMGLNLDVDHVAFASNRKFDGYQHRALTAAELAQIAGRAGRHTRDGTFGVTGRVSPFEDELVVALETHSFAPLRVFQWRNSALDFASVPALRASLDRPAQEDGLTKAPPADDQKALEHAIKSSEVKDLADIPARVELLWEVCQIPDYRKIAPATHADLISALFQFLVNDGKIPDDWFNRQVQYADKIDGDIDTLSNRIAHVRTWTFVANRNDWLADPPEWRETTRKVEDRLSDALHERLMQRFVDRRTSVLMKRLRENAMLESEVNDAGDVMVEGQHVGTLHGFRFQADATPGDPRDQKALRSAAGKALAKEMERRADKAAVAPDNAFALGSDAVVRWQGAIVSKITASDDALRPNAVLLADETLPVPSREKVQARLTQWLAASIEGLLKPLFDLRNAEGMDGPARGLAYRISEGFGSVERSTVADEAKALDQAARAGLRALGIRFGAYHIFVPALLKPAPSQLLALLWALKNADLDVPGLTEVPQLSASGRTSIAVDPQVPAALYQVVGFRKCGPRAVRIDILERLADQIRPLVAWRPGPDAGDPPPGAVPTGGGFLVTVAMTSLLGCSGEDFAAVLGSLGYRVDRHEANPAEREAIRAASEVRARGTRAKPSRLPLPVRATGPAPRVATPEPAEAAEPAAMTADLTDDPSPMTASASDDAPAMRVAVTDDPSAMTADLTDDLSAMTASVSDDRSEMTVAITDDPSAAMAAAVTDDPGEPDAADAEAVDAPDASSQAYRGEAEVGTDAAANGTDVLAAHVPGAQAFDAPVPDADAHVPDAYVPDAYVPDAYVLDGPVPDAHVPYPHLPDAATTESPADEHAAGTAPESGDDRETTTWRLSDIAPVPGAEAELESGESGSQSPADIDVAADGPVDADGLADGATEPIGSVADRLGEEMPASPGELVPAVTEHTGPGVAHDSEGGVSPDVAQDSAIDTALVDDETPYSPAENAVHDAGQTSAAWPAVDAEAVTAGPDAGPADDPDARANGIGVDDEAGLVETADNEQAVIDLAAETREDAWTDATADHALQAGAIDDDGDGIGSADGMTGEALGAEAIADDEAVDADGEALADGDHIAADEAPATDDGAAVIIEVWRVPRHQRSDQQRRRRGGQSAGRDDGQAAAERGRDLLGDRPDAGAPGGRSRSGGRDGRQGGRDAHARGGAANGRADGGRVTEGAPGGRPGGHRHGRDDRGPRVPHSPDAAAAQSEAGAGIAMAADGVPLPVDGLAAEPGAAFAPGVEAGQPSDATAAEVGTLPHDRNRGRGGGERSGSQREGGQNRGSRDERRRDDRRNERGGRDDRSGDALRGKGGKPQRPEPSSQPTRREADPDSPFAALAALKERMEKGNR